MKIVHLQIPMEDSTCKDVSILISKERSGAGWMKFADSLLSFIADGVRRGEKKAMAEPVELFSRLAKKVVDMQRPRERMAMLEENIISNTRIWECEIQ